MPYYLSGINLDQSLLEQVTIIDHLQICNERIWDAITLTRYHTYSALFGVLRSRRKVRRQGDKASPTNQSLSSTSRSSPSQIVTAIHQGCSLLPRQPTVKTSYSRSRKYSLKLYRILVLGTPYVPHCCSKFKKNRTGQAYTSRTISHYCIQLSTSQGRLNWSNLVYSAGVLQDLCPSNKTASRVLF